MTNSIYDYNSGKYTIMPQEVLEQSFDRVRSSSNERFTIKERIYKHTNNI